MSEITIPFYGLNKFYHNNRKKILELTDTAYKNGQFLKSNNIREFEKQLASYCNRKYAITVGSGTDALYFALKAIGVDSGDEVIVTSFSFIASASSILRAGAIPVFTDIDPDNFQMDLIQLESAITSNSKAIIAVQLFGQTMNIEHLEQISEKYNIPVIEDAAQSLGSTFKSMKSGGIGTLSCLSFDPTKIIGAFGTGGAILTDDLQFLQFIKTMAHNGKSGALYTEAGYNSQINSAQAGLLSWQLNSLDSTIEQRQMIAKLYKDRLDNIGGLLLPVVSEDNNHTYHKFVIRSMHRDALQKYLLTQGVQTLIHYKNALFEHPVFTNSNCRKGETGNVLKCASEVLSLPVYPELSSKEIDYICNAIHSFYAIKS